MTTLCFATNNNHKLEEVRQILPDFRILSLNDISCYEELPENQSTLEGNSLEKAEYVFNNFNIPCFADDTGLEVEALRGAPGVFSARYAGEHKNSEDNINLLLKNLSGVENRKAQFRTVITLIDGHATYTFEGVVKGTIAQERKGIGGFGYDPVFVPQGYTLSFAQMSTSEKNTISHRGVAISRLADFLGKQLARKKSDSLLP